MTTTNHLPEKVLPMLAVTAEPFDSQDYWFEIKWDGLRCLAFLTQEETRLQSRNQKDITFQYPELWQLHKTLKTNGAILDGEALVLDQGIPSFFKLQSRMHSQTKERIQSGMRKNPVLYVVFDLLYFKGESLLNTPLWKRREYLEEIFVYSPHLLLSTYFPEKGRAFFAQMQKLGLEGMVGKERNSLYLPGKRSPAWRKCRVTKSGHFIICGYTTNPKGRKDLSALAVAGKDLHTQGLYSFGLVGTGFSQAEITYLLGLLKPRIIAQSPLAHPPEDTLQKAVWVKPELVCEVEYLEITPDRHLRHPLYRGLRLEISPEECQVSAVNWHENKK